jgi:hypothetical protein
MLDERPPKELPPRASAIAGMRAMTALKSSASSMRQFSCRLAVVALIEETPGKLSARYRRASPPVKAPRPILVSGLGRMAESGRLA